MFRRSARSRHRSGNAKSVIRSSRRSRSPCKRACCGISFSRSHPAFEFRCTASRRHGKLPSIARPSGEFGSGNRTRGRIAHGRRDDRGKAKWTVCGHRHFELRDTNGNIVPTQARTVLCRCGASTKSPSATVPTRRSDSRLRQKRCPAQPRKPEREFTATASGRAESRRILRFSSGPWPDLSRPSLVVRFRLLR